ncbi:DUF2238 domain-containing protein [Bacillus sp. T33-2]|uniref:DUF2238 domain-containing protein n=1 Tax=Bacillus sp. T33-2 TaxID=2054168 RepID=UPI000C76673B|nr:DUF2238 domain-containing protein [Bacillus sp. T33-2]PLR95283.1 DUF2238 domain-containing protein [Bacillus sp. T33-2]
MKKDKSTSVHVILLLIVIAVLIWSVIKPYRYHSWLMEAGPTILALIPVVATYKRFRFTTLSYVIIALLSILTFIGGHYVYSNVPAFDWLKDQYDLSRNYYDRFGHFLKGLLAIVIREILLRKTPLKKGAWLFAIVISMVTTIAALYEIAEWLSSYVNNGGKVQKDFLGAQGSTWDTQWDISLSLTGALLSLLLLTKLHDRQLEKKS